MEKMVSLMKTEKSWLESELERRGLAVWRTRTNFTVFRVPEGGNSKEVHRAIAAKGIIVRDRSSIPMRENCIRVTVGPRSENKRFLQALDEVLAP